MTPPGTAAASPLDHPVVGGLYRLDTVLVSGRDPKAKRPAVVLAMPAHGLTDVPVLTRTSDTAETGIAHPRNPSLGLSKDGVFAFRFLRSVDARLLRVPALSEFLGMLEPEYFERILDWWERT